MFVSSFGAKGFVESAVMGTPHKKVLFISNGAGEDACGATIADALRSRVPNLALEAVPLVGRGNAYERAGVTVSGPRLEMPSGGFMTTGLPVLLADLRAGFARMSHEQYWAVRRSQADAVFVVGDIYATWVARRFVGWDGRRPPVFHYQSLVSLYYQDGLSLSGKLQRGDRYLVVDSFNPVERWLMRTTDTLTFVRDERSAAWLRAHGVPEATCVGNVMMDMLEPEVNLEPLLAGRRVIGLLPGTRDDHHSSLPVMLEVAKQIPWCLSLVALPGDPSSIALPDGWHWVEPSALEASVSASRVALHFTGVRVAVLQRAFASIVHAASVVIGTSGTGNEQAVGAGKPVVSFPTLGPQFLPAFATAQRRLLGSAVTLVNRSVSEIVEAVEHALQNPLVTLEAQRVGQERMGSSGATARIADAVVSRLGWA